MSDAAAPATAPADLAIAPTEILTPAEPTARAPERISSSDAGRILAEARRKRSEQPAAPQEAAAAPESSAAPQEEPPAETSPVEANPAEETLPPIEPPRS